MKTPFVLWIVSFLIAAGILTYQRMTGPTYPVKTRTTIGDYRVSAKLLRTQTTGEDLPVKLDVAMPAGATDGVPALGGIVRWRRFPTDDPWDSIDMEYQDGQLVAEIPTQPMAGKVEYHVVLQRPGVSEAGPALQLPESRPVVARFKRAVPAWNLILHIFFISLAILWSTRSGVEALLRRAAQRRHTILTCVFLFVAGFILGPLLQKYAFDAYWTGWPFGHDLTDNKVAAAALVWLVALIRGRGGRNARGWIVVASLVTLAVFLVPHSVLGSELDWSKIPAK